MSNEWTLVCKVDADYVDIASVFLFDAGATAISETHGDYRIELRAGFLDEDTAQAAVVDLAQRLPDTPCVAFLDTRQDEWINLQREGLSPTTIGPWTIRAPWHRAQTSASDTEIVIDPGAAFGHGEELDGSRRVLVHKALAEPGVGGSHVQKRVRVELAAARQGREVVDPTSGQA